VEGLHRVHAEHAASAVALHARDVYSPSSHPRQLWKTASASAVQLDTINCPGEEFVHGRQTVSLRVVHSAAR
jgi:hypothetical protein